MKIAFLDRDGTINKDYPDEMWRMVKTPEFFGDSIKALQELTNMGYKIIIITNQYLIGEGYISMQDYLDFTHKFTLILKKNNVEILDIFYCPYPRDGDCKCCKPRTGLIEQALEKYPKIDLSKSFYCGDSLCDYELAKAIGVRFFGINISKCESVQIASLMDLKAYLN